MRKEEEGASRRRRRNRDDEAGKEKTEEEEGEVPQGVEFAFFNNGLPFMVDMVVRLG